MKNHRTLFAVALTAASLLGTAQAAEAQSATVNATVTVVTSMTVTGNRNLAFPQQTTGSATFIVDPSTPEAAAFTLTGTPGTEVSIEFTTLPTELSDGTNTIGISFALNSAAHDAINNPGAATTFNPAAPITRLLDVTTGQAFVWLGGSLDAIPVGQPTGTYLGVITLEAAYTGN